MKKTKKQLKKNFKKNALHKRYLLWLYKTVKDELEKIDRKFTQMDIDRKIQAKLIDACGLQDQKTRKELEPFLQEWKEYIFSKESSAQKLKFTEEGKVNPEYLFLRMKFEAVCEVTRALFGPEGLREFESLLEAVALERILQDVSGRR